MESQCDILDIVCIENICDSIKYRNVEISTPQFGYGMGAYRKFKFHYMYDDNKFNLLIFVQCPLVLILY